MSGSGVSGRLSAVVEEENSRLLSILSLALHAWSELGLEIGEAAVVTGSGPLARMLALVAALRGGTPVIHEVAGTRAADEIRRAAPSRPGFAAVDVGGDVKEIDLLLDAAPRFGRLLLASPAMTPLTLDYYNNIHRKGVVLICRRLEPAFVTDLSRVRALKILEDAELRARCLTAVTGTECSS